MLDISKENLIPLLEKYYQSFIDETEDWSFFVELSEYIDLILENNLSARVIAGLNSQREEDLKPLRDIEAIATADLNTAKEKIKKLLNKGKITSKGIEFALKKLEQIEAGKVYSNVKPIDKLYDAIWHICVAIHEEGKQEIIKEYFNAGDGKHRYTDNYFYIEIYDQYQRLKRASEFKEKSALWYVWDKINIAHFTIRKTDETFEQLKEEGKKWEMLNFSGIVQEMRKIQSIAEENHPFARDFDPIIFKRDDFVQYARRFHKHLIKTLLETDPKTHHLTENSPSFDESLGILWIDGKPVKFGLKTGAFHSLRVMFQSADEAKREWFFSEIAEAIDEAEPKPDKLIHNYFNNTIKTKIVSETGIKDFFLTTNQSVKINQKYLSEKS